MINLRERVAVGRVTCLIQPSSATIIFDNGAKLTVPRKHDEPPEKTAASVAKLLLVDRFDYSRVSG